MDSEYATHVAAILVGVLVTLALVNGFSGTKTVDTPTGAASGASSSGGMSKNQKKKKKKKGKSGAVSSAGGGDKPKQTTTSRSLATSDPAPGHGEEEKKEEEPEPKPANGGKKKKKKAKKPANGNVNNGSSNGNGKKENEPKAANAAPPAPAQPVMSEWQTAPQEEEWNDVVVTKKKPKNRYKAPKPAATAADGAAPAAAPTSSETIVVDAKKIGIIIGPKGATMQAIQAATGCTLDINAPPKDDKANKAPKASVVIAGPDKESCFKAKTAVNELATKGYARLLQEDGFGEFSIEVHPRFLSEIVGPGGSVIKALQTTLQVKVTIPSTEWKPGQVQTGKIKMCRVGIAGSKENAKTAKAAIKQLMEFHHSEITHPGFIHEEVYVPQEFFHCVIGPRGSEIKHIRGNYKVDMYMPNHDSNTENVVVVGKQGNVDKAISYIQLLMDRDTEQREKKYSDEYYD